MTILKEPRGARIDPAEIPQAVDPRHRSVPGPRGMSGFTAAVVGLDMVLLTGAAIAAGVVRFGSIGSEIAGAWRGSNLGGVPYIVVAIVITGCWVAALAMRGAYDTKVFGTATDEYKRVVAGSVLTAGLVAIVSYLGKVEIARGYVAVAFPLGTGLLVAGRFGARKWLQRRRRQGRMVHRVLAVGSPPGVRDLLAVLRREPQLGFDVVGACLPDQHVAARLDVPVLGGLDDIAAAVERSRADTVAVTGVPGQASWFLRRLSWALEGSGVDLVVVPSLTDVAGPRIHVRPVAGLPLLHVEEPEFRGARRVVKAVFDWLAAALLFLVALPAMVAIAAAIRLDDRGPVFFRQTRVGVHGREFGCWKFRSMVVDAETHLPHLQRVNEQDGVLFKIRRDPRMTRIGRLLRALSLDELPQLINVLRGEMSLVGPRPPLPSEVRQYGEAARRRLLVRPGITGLWQVSGRSRLSWDDTVRLDLYYVENWSLSADLVILARTVRAVLSRDGAY